MSGGAFLAKGDEVSRHGDLLVKGGSGQPGQGPCKRYLLTVCKFCTAGRGTC